MAADTVKTILSGASVSAGGTVTAVARTAGETTVLRVNGASGATDVTIDVTGVKLADSEASFATLNTADSFANQDVSGDKAYKLDTVGYETVELTLTNNLASAVTIDAVKVRTEQ